jgi:hypothetical protein
VNGIDISNYQSGARIDWSGIGFCFIEASDSEGYGGTTKCPTLDPQWADCPVAKGVYHFMRPSLTTNAEDFLAAIADLPGIEDAPKALDYEIETFDRGMALDWIEKVKAKYPNGPVGVYSDGSGFASLGGAAGLGDFSWLAWPTTNGPMPFLPDIRQTDIVGGVDQDVITGKSPFRTIESETDVIVVIVPVAADGKSVGPAATLFGPYKIVDSSGVWTAENALVKQGVAKIVGVPQADYDAFPNWELPSVVAPGPSGGLNTADVQAAVASALAAAAAKIAG